MKKISILIMMLMIMIPIATAQELSITKYTGENGINGYAKTTDKILIEANAKIPGETIIAKEQMRIYVDEGYAFFDSCTTVGATGDHKCTFYEPDFESYEPLTFKIELRNDDGTIVKTDTKTIYLDNQPPVIKDFSVDKEQTGGDVTISYTAEDYALTIGNTQQCAGIKTIAITAGTKAITETATQGTCTKTNTIKTTLTPDQTPLCITATDYLGLKSAPKCIKLLIDNQPPEIKEIKITSDGLPLTHTKEGQEKIATISTVIVDENDIELATAYLGELNTDLQIELQPDIINANTYSWTNIPVTQVNPCKLKITARDVLGNQKTKDYDCSIKQDDIPPTNAQIIAQTQNNLPLVGKGTKLTIKFDETDNTGKPGIGMTGRKAYLDLSNLGLGTKQAETCNAGWTCTWTINSPKPEGEYNIKLTAQDDLGNQMTPKDFKIYYDITGPDAPVITDFKVIKGPTPGPGPVKDDYAQYKVKSANFATGKANFTTLGTQELTPPIGCTDTECTFETKVQLSGPYNAQIEIMMIDNAGNTASVQTTTQVYGIQDEQNPAYWNIKQTQCSPKLIDRSTAGIIPQYVTCETQLTTQTDAQTISIRGPNTPDKCTGNTEYIDQIYITNNQEESTTPNIFIKLMPANYYINELNLTCPLTIYSKINNNIIPTPQNINTTFTLKFYNQPLGTIHDNDEQALRDAMHKGIANQEWITTWKKGVDALKYICNMKNVITSAWAGISRALDILAFWNGVVPGSTEGERKELCLSKEKLVDFYQWDWVKALQPYCDIINCASTTEEGGGFLGGGAQIPMCQNTKKWVEEGGFIQSEEAMEGVKQLTGQLPSIQVQDSLVLSALCLCPTGIIQNLQKLQELYCFEAVCLNDMVKQGTPKTFCKQMTSYLTCTYIVGETIAWIPILQLADQTLKIIVDTMSNPAKLIDWVIAYLGAKDCKKQCLDPSGVTYTLCSAARDIKMVSDAIASYRQYHKIKNAMFKPIGTQYCDRMKEIQNELGIK